MKSAQFSSRLQVVFALCILAIAACCTEARIEAQAAPEHSGRSFVHITDKTNKAEARSIPALMISDIHFDPFHDPAKLRQLVEAPTTEWTSILTAPSSLDQQQAFDSLQEKCHARGVDTPYALLHSSIQAMKSRQPNAAFMTVSGDLIAHAFPCRFKTLLPQSTPSDYQTFVLKTLSFIVTELQTAFPNMPIYMALGNNDSNCGDYQLDEDSDFLKQTGTLFAGMLPFPRRDDVIRQFPAGGYYSLEMAAPMHATRLIALNDVFLSPKYTTCGSLPVARAGDDQIAWLKQQLEDARKLHQNVWVLGHIPPGVNVYSTVAKMKNICDKAKPDMFLSSDALTDTLVENADVIRLAIFAHTHMDEIRLLQPENSDGKTSDGHRIGMKMVPSISPVDGNDPSFTVAQINPSTAMLQDYEVVRASNQTGVGTTWSTEYDFAQTYHESEFSPTSVAKTIAEFKADPDSTQAVSEAYIRNFFVGDRSIELKPFWPQYVCGLANSSAKSFTECVCSAHK